MTKIEGTNRGGGTGKNLVIKDRPECSYLHTIVHIIFKIYLSNFAFGMPGALVSPTAHLAQTTIQHGLHIEGEVRRPRILHNWSPDTGKGWLLNKIRTPVQVHTPHIATTTTPGTVRKPRRRETYGPTTVYFRQSRVLRADAYSGPEFICFLGYPLGSTLGASLSKKISVKLITCDNWL